MTAGVVMGISYGREISPKSDPYVALSKRTASAFEKAIRPGAFLVDFFPMRL